MSFATDQIPRFWEVSLNIQVEGTYACRQDGRQLEGTFAGFFCWEGLMEPDEPDVILYHLRTDVRSWEVKEKEAGSSVSSGFLPVASDPPVLTVTTFLRRGDLFDLHFFISSFFVPLSLSRPGCRLIMPASSGQDLRNQNVRYNDYVFEGSNRVAISADELFSRESHHTITWSWRFPPDGLRKEVQEFRSEHRVRVKLEIKPRF